MEDFGFDVEGPFGLNCAVADYIDGKDNSQCFPLISFVTSFQTTVLRTFNSNSKSQ